MSRPKHFHVFHTSLEVTFLSSLFTFSIPHVNLACKWTCSPQPPLLAHIFPSFHQCCLSDSNSGKAGALFWVMATDAQVTRVQLCSVSALPSVICALRQMSAETEISLRRFEQKAAGSCSIRNFAYLLYMRPVNVFFFLLLYSNFYQKMELQINKCSFIWYKNVGHLHLCFRSKHKPMKDTLW